MKVYILALLTWVSTFPNQYADWEKQQVTSILPQNNSKRHFVILGNSNYQFENVLPICETDADSMAKRLIDYGFSPTIQRNLSFQKMKQFYEDFITNLPLDSEVIFYYSGHGLHVGQQDFLLPIDFSFDCLNYSKEIENKAISLQSIINKLARKNIKNSVIILDACRNITWKCKDQCLGSDFDDALTISNIAIFFSSTNCKKSGYNTSISPNSFFTTGLLYALNQPQLSLGEVFSKAYTKTKELAELSNYEQTPISYLQSGGMIINNLPLPNISKNRCMAFFDSVGYYRETGKFRRVYNNTIISLGMASIQAQNNALILLGNRIAQEVTSFGNYLDSVDISNNEALEIFKSTIKTLSQSSFKVTEARKLCEEEFEGNYYYTLEVPKSKIRVQSSQLLLSKLPTNGQYSKKEINEISEKIRIYFNR